MCLTRWEARCVPPARLGIWHLAAGIWLFEVTLADPRQLSFKVFHLSSSVTRKSSVLVCLFSGVSGHLISLMYLKNPSFCTSFGWDGVNGFVWFSPSLSVRNFLSFSGGKMRFLSLFVYARVCVN